MRQLGIAWADNGTIYKNPTIDTLTARLRRGRDNEPLDPTVVTMFRLMDTYSNFATREPNDTACMEHLEKVEDGTAEAYPDGHHVVSFHHPLSACPLPLEARSLKYVSDSLLLVPLAPLGPTLSPNL